MMTSLGPWSNPPPPSQGEHGGEDDAGDDSPTPGVEPHFILSLLRALVPPDAADADAPAADAYACEGEEALEAADRARIDACCVLWDLALTPSYALLCHEHGLVSLALWPLASPGRHSDRLLEVCAGTLAALAGVPSIRSDMLARDDLARALLGLLLASPCAELLAELVRLLSALLTQPPQAHAAGGCGETGGEGRDGAVGPACESAALRWLKTRLLADGSADGGAGGLGEFGGLVGRLTFVLRSSQRPALLTRTAGLLEALLFLAPAPTLRALAGAPSAWAQIAAPEAAAPAAEGGGLGAEEGGDGLAQLLLARLAPAACEELPGGASAGFAALALSGECCELQCVCGLLALLQRALACAAQLAARGARPGGGEGASEAFSAGEWAAVEACLGVFGSCRLWELLARALGAPWAELCAGGAGLSSLAGASYGCADEEEAALLACALLAELAALPPATGARHGPAQRALWSAGPGAACGVCELLRLAVQRARDLPTAGGALAEEGGQALPVWRCAGLLSERLDGLSLAISDDPADAPDRCEAGAPERGAPAAGRSPVLAAPPTPTGPDAADPWPGVQHGVFRAFALHAHTLGSAHGLARCAAAVCERARRGAARGARLADGALPAWTHAASAQAEAASAQVLDDVLRAGDLVRMAGDLGGQLAESMGSVRFALDAELEDAWQWHALA